MIVTFERVSINNGFGIIMFYQQRTQIGCCLRQVVDLKSHILNQTGGTNGSCTANSRENSRSHCPVSIVFRCFIGEAGGIEEVEF